mmetsp:Transcript_2919/g.5004  ORF Transcript_2919/g.5004 Transcript_2919/m.5004 type:complete len:384 (-) Transcript_2919:220-1371(-)
MNADEQILAQEKQLLDKEKARLDEKEARLDKEKALLEELPADDPRWRRLADALVADKQALVADKQMLATDKQAFLELTRASAAGGAGMGATAGAQGHSPGTSVEGLLRDLLHEVRYGNRLTKARLADKHRYSTSQATKFRDPEFKKNLVKEYGCKRADGHVRCMLLDDYFPYELVRGSHLFKYSWRDDVQEVMGFTCINNPRNGLLLLTPLEEAFDNGYLVFEFQEPDVGLSAAGGAAGGAVGGRSFVAHWLGNDQLKIHDFGNFPWNTNEKTSQDLQALIRRHFPGATFKALVDGKPLTLTTELQPYKRCLAYQAKKAIKQALTEGRITESWLIGKRFDTHSPAATNIQAYYSSIPEGGADDPEEQPAQEDFDLELSHSSLS